MLTASQPPDAPSALRVGLSAGKSLLGGLMLGALLALVLGCGAAVFYFSRLMADPGQGIHASAHTGIYGAVISLLISPPLLVAVVLIFIIPAYLMVGLQLGRARAAGKLVARYGQGLAERLAAMLAQRIEALPSAHKAMHKAADLLTVGAAMEHLQPWVGNGRAVQFVVRSVLNRLPLADLLEEWGHTRAQWGSEGGKDDPALRAFLGARIQEMLQGLTEPPWTLLWILLAGHAAVLGFGIWLTA